MSIMVIPSNLNLLLTFGFIGKIEQKHIEVMGFTQQKTAGVQGGVEGGVLDLHALWQVVYPMQ